MKNTLLIGVAAAALLAGINVASAQGTMQPPAGASQPADMKGGDQKGKAAVDQKGKAGAEIKSEKPATNAQAPASNAQAQDKMKADTSAKPDRAKAQDAQKQDDGSKNAQSKPADSKSGASAQSDSKAKGSTTGQGSAGNAKASLTVEQKTKIRETVFKSSNAPRVTNVNFSINVGTVVPRTVKFAPVPTILVEYYPAWRGYEYFIVGEQLIIIEPSSFKIIAILDV